MILTKIDYDEQPEEPTYWRIKDVNLGNFNLIVGLNATGKTRLTNVISSLAAIIMRRRRTNGHWNLEFYLDGENPVKYRYELVIKNQVVEKETLRENRKVLLQRTRDKGTILSKRTGKNVQISPPERELMFHVRRDIVEFPFFEHFFAWAESCIYYTFSGIRPNEIGPNPEMIANNLVGVPKLIIEANQQRRDRILEDFRQIGYPIDRIGTTQFADIKIITVKESDLNCETIQVKMSAGMYRVLSLIAIIEQWLESGGVGTFIIDDIGEGLDYKRSSKLVELLRSKMQGADRQFIITSNNRFLINSVDIRDINFLNRKGHVASKLE